MAFNAEQLIWVGSERTIADDTVMDALASSVGSVGNWRSVRAQGSRAT